MTLSQAQALASRCRYPLKVKKSSYKQIKTDHLDLYDILGFQNMVFISMHFDIWYTMYVPDKQTELWLFLSEMAWTCSFPTLRRVTLIPVISERWTLPTSSYKLDHSAAWNSRVRGRKRAEKWKNDSIHWWLHHLLGERRALWSCFSQVLSLWVSLCLM